MASNSIFRITNYEIVNNEHIVTFMEQHRDFNKVLSAAVPVSPDDGTLEDVAAVAWTMVRDEFDAWRASVNASQSIVRRFFEVDPQGNLVFLV